MGVGMARLVQGGFETVADLAADPLGERLDHGNALAVAAQRLGVKIEGVGVVRRRFLQASRARRVLEQPGFFREIIDEIVA